MEGERDGWGRRRICGGELRRVLSFRRSSHFGLSVQSTGRINHFSLFNQSVSWFSQSVSSVQSPSLVQFNKVGSVNRFGPVQ